MRGDTSHPRRSQALKTRHRKPIQIYIQTQGCTRVRLRVGLRVRVRLRVRLRLRVRIQDP